MFTIFRKEVNSFFSSLIGYIAIGVYLVLLSLFLWIFPATNILDYGYASLDFMFATAPLILMVLIPAITMRLIAEETREGTIELLATRPLSDSDIILGKYLAALFLVFFAILPTFVYYISVYQLGSPKGNLDTGGIIGSYIGLFLLSAAFTAVGMFASALGREQVVSFIIGVLINAFMYLGFQYISKLPVFYGKSDDIVESLGMSRHYDDLSRGLIDMRDVIYFISVAVIFFLLTKFLMERRKW